MQIRGVDRHSSCTTELKSLLIRLQLSASLPITISTYLPINPLLSFPFPRPVLVKQNRKPPLTRFYNYTLALHQSIFPFVVISSRRCQSKINHLIIPWYLLRNLLFPRHVIQYHIYCILQSRKESRKAKELQLAKRHEDEGCSRRFIDLFLLVREDTERDACGAKQHKRATDIEEIRERVSRDRRWSKK